jgi:glycosyltransferase involved in cell wall biosynthesis
MINVFVNVGVHPRYKYMIEYPPEGVKYIVQGNPDIKQYYNINKEGKKRMLIRRYSNYAIKYIGLPRIWYYLNTYNADLIYSTRGIIPLNDKPFIVEAEHPLAFVGLDPANYGIRQKFWINLLLHRKVAKKIIFTAEKAAEVMKSEFPKLKDKVDFVYAAIPFKEIKRIKHKGFIITMFNRGDIYSRGLRTMLNILPILRKKYPDVKLRVVTGNVLQEDQLLFKKYEVEWINHFLNEEEEDQLFASSDVFVHLTYVDTAGNIIYNAMRAGLPLILSDIFSNPEKVINYKNGFLIHVPVSLFDERGMIRKLSIDLSRYSDKKVERDLLEKIEYLIEHPNEKIKMGEYNKELIRSGKFSMQERNKKLKKIFEEAIS